MQEKRKAGRPPLYGAKNPPRLIFRYSPEATAELKAAAARAGLNVGDAIREAISQWIKRQARRQQSDQEA